MALSITGGSNTYNLREPSVINNPVDAHRQVLSSFNLSYTGDSAPSVYTLAIEVGPGTEIQFLNGNKVGVLQNSGTLAELNAWLDSLYFAAEDKELGNGNANSSLKLTLTADGEAAAVRNSTATITFANDPTTIESGLAPNPIVFVVEEGAQNATVTGTEYKDDNSGDVVSEGVLRIRDPELGVGSQQPQQIVYRVDATPEHGFLKLNGSVLGVGSVFTHADVIAGKVTYRHTSLGANENANDAFKVTVNDGATPIDQSQQSTITIQIAPTNQTPQANDNNGHVYENQPYLWQGSNVGQYISAYAGVEGERNDRDPGDKLTVIIEKVPVNGDLYFDFGGGPIIVKVDDEIPYDQRNNLKYQHRGDDPTTPALANDSFDFRVRDSGGGVDGEGKPIGAPLTSEIATVSLSVRPVNDIPVSSGATSFTSDVPSAGAGAHVVNLKDAFFPADNAKKLAITDPDTPTDKRFFVLSEYPQDPEGWIYVNGQPLPPGGRFSQADLEAGRVTFVQHHAGAGAGDVDQFKFKIVDNAVSPRWDEEGTLFTVPGGVYPGNNPKDGDKFANLQDFVVDFKLAPAGDNPGWEGPPDAPNYTVVPGGTEYAGPKFGGNAIGELVEGDTILLGNGLTADIPGLNYGITSEGNAVTVPADTVIYTITAYTPKVGTVGEPNNTVSGEFNGVLQKKVGAEWVDLNLFSTFTQADLNSGDIRFKHDGGEDFHSQVKFSVSSGLTTTPWEPTFDFYIQPINDKPVATGSGEHLVREGYRADNPVFGSDDRSFYITTEHLSFSDADDSNSSLDYSGLETADFVNGERNYALNNGSLLKFEVTDLPDNGKLQWWNGTQWLDVTVGQTLDASLVTGAKNNNAGNVTGGTGLRYFHDGDEFNPENAAEATDSFKVKAVDRWANDPLNKSEEATVKFRITPVNDTPEIARTPNEADPTGRWPQDVSGSKAGKNEPLTGVLEGSQDYHKLNADMLQAVDADSNATQVQYRVSKLPEEGNLYRNNGTDATPNWVLIGVNGSFTQQEVIDGKIAYGKHNGSEPQNLPGSGPSGWNAPHDRFEFVLSDGSGEQTGREFWIYVNPTNDRPAVAAGNSLIVIPEGGTEVSGFKVSDPDTGSGVYFTDYVQVTVRLSDSDGNPLALSDYAGVKIATSELNHGATVSGSFNGDGQALRISGTHQQVNEYLAKLTLNFDNNATPNRNSSLRIEVIADDRLRDASGALEDIDTTTIGLQTGANGGQNLNDGKNGTAAPSGNDFSPYLIKADEIGDVGNEFHKNVNINHRDIFISDLNEGPTARDDTNTITEKAGTWTKPDFPTTTGNVVAGDLKGGMRDTDIDLTDTLTVIGVAVGGEGAVANVNVNTEIEGKYGWLVLGPDGSYTYKLNNNHPDVKVLKPGSTPLTDDFRYLITDNNSSKDPAGEKTAQAKLTITINGVDDPAPSITPVDHNGALGGHNQVFESGLRSPSDSDTRDTTTGSVTVKAAAGIHEITVTRHDGTKETLNLTQLANLGTTPVTVDTGEGTLVLTGFKRIQTLDGVFSEGELSYKYTLKAELVHPTDTAEAANSLFDRIPLGVTDKEGDTSAGELVIRIVDDVPTAFNNENQITEDLTDNTVSGNVVTDAGKAGTDVIGADGAAVNGPVTQINGAGTNVGTPVTGLYGKVVIKADGSYEYELDNSNPTVNALRTGQTLTEEFEYTITDSDGDASTAKLVITINGVTDGGVNDPNIQIIGGSSQVYESGLRSPDDANTSNVTNGVIEVVSLDGIGKVVIGNQTFSLADIKDKEITTPHGKLTLGAFVPTESVGDVPTKGTINYTYEIVSGQTHTKPTLDLSFDDVIDLKVISNPAPGQNAIEQSGLLTITIYDDVPEAQNDSAGVVEDGNAVATGSVLVNDAPGGDTLATLPVTNVRFGTASYTPGTKIPATYGEITINSDGSYTYTLNNGHPAVNALKNGQTLTEEFEYTIIDKDGDTSSAKLVVTINGADDAPPSITPNGGNEVSGHNEVSEVGLPGGTEAGQGADKTTGTIKVEAHAGIKEITITKPDNTVVTVDLARLDKLADSSGSYGALEIDTGEGTLILTAFVHDKTENGFVVEGTLSYQYVLKEKQLHPEDNKLFDEIPLGVVDNEGDLAKGTLVIRIADDKPDARDNENQVTEDHSTNTVSGNVVTNPGAAGTDAIGADGSAVNGPVTQINGAGTNVGTSVTGLYGKVVINADGSYEYTLDNNNPTVNALLTGQTLTDDFTYTIEDSDGDTSTAKLIITINGVTDADPKDPTAPNIRIIGGSNLVYESGLRSDTDTNNSQKTDPAKVHVIDVTALDGIGKVVIGDKTFDLDALEELSVANVVIDTPHGKLKLTGFTGAEPVGGIPTKGKISYEYEIVTGQPHDKATHDKDFDDVIKLEVISHEILGKTPAKAEGDLTIKIYDDVPEARDDYNGVVEDGGTEAKGNVLDNDEPGGDKLIDKAVISVSFGGKDYAPGEKIKTSYGEVTINDDGTYIYVLDNYSPAVQNLQQGQLVDETVRYTIIDKDGDTSQANLRITITGSSDGGTTNPEVPVNQVPEVVGGPIPEQVDVDSQDIVPVDVTKHFRDPEGGKLTYTVEGLPPSLVFDPETGKITGAPHHSASQQGVANNGIYDVKVTATDPNGASTSFNFKWTVSNVPPYAKDDVARTSPTEVVRGNVVRGDDRGYGRDGDPDQDPFIVSYINNTGVSSQGATVKGSNGGTFTVQRDGSYTFDPGSDFSGLGSTETRKTSITYTIADSDGGTARATLTVTVAGKDVPVGPQPIIPNSDVVITLDHAPALSPDGTPYSTSGTAGQVDELHSDFSVRLSGDAENVVLTGHKAANVWDNASGNVIYGNAGANTIYLSGGRDVVDGGSGYDLLVLSKAKSDYTFDFSKGVAEIRDNATGFIVTAASIEAVSFNGQAVDPVRALYDAYYGRAATEAEYASATTLLKEGVSVAEVGSKLAASSEAQAHIGQGSNADFIKSVYSSVLGRAASDDEAGWWAGQIEQGGVSRTDAVLRFVDSEEFGDRYVSLFTADHSDIAGLYRIVMGRDPDKDGFIFWSQRSAEGETLREIALDFYYSDEFQARISSTSHTDLVTDFYADLLRREPDAEGLAYWVGELDRDQRSAANVAQSILESDEFRQNVDTLLNRADWLDVF